MSIPVVNVTVIVYSQDGNPVENASISAIIKTTEVYDGFVLPNIASAITNATGTAVVSVFPNELGSEGSEYEFTIFNPLLNKSIILSAVIPNEDCNLWEVADLTPYAKKSILDSSLYMLKSDYDVDKNKIVDEAEKIDGGNFV